MYDAAWPAMVVAMRVRCFMSASRDWGDGDAADDAVLALVAWDYAGGLMDLPAEQVKVLAILGDQAAILMYSAIESKLGNACSVATSIISNCIVLTIFSSISTFLPFPFFPCVVDSRRCSGKGRKGERAQILHTQWRRKYE